MPIYLRQSTASQVVSLGQFVDSTDGDTEKSALTIANTDIKVWKTGATSVVSKNSGGATYMSNAVYYTVLDATDSDTIGPMVLFIHVSGALAVRVECCVLASAVYDAMFGTTAPAVAGDAMALTSAERNSVADAFIGRNIAGGSSTGRTVKDALSFLRNKWTLSGSTLTVYDTDDTTILWTATVATTVGANPVTGSDPA